MMTTYYTRRQTAALFGVAYETVMRWERKGALTSVPNPIYKRPVRYDGRQLARLAGEMQRGDIVARLQRARHDAAD